MSETDSGAEVTVPPAEGNSPQRAPRKSLPGWLWSLLAALVLALLVLGGIYLFASLNARNADAALPVSSPSASSTATATPTPTLTATSTPAPTPSAVANAWGQGVFDSDMTDNMSTILYTQNTAVLDEGGTFTNPVHVVVANSGQDSNLSPADAIDAMYPMFVWEDPYQWDLALPESMLESYRNGPYGQYFPVGAIVARSHAGNVFSFIGHDRSISTMFMAASEDQLK